MAGNDTRAEPRALDEILPERGDAARSRDMQATWQAFCLERHETVRRALDSGRTAPEIAYQLGELVHTYFRPRGVMLTGQELRRLVAELLEPTASRSEAPAAAARTGGPNSEPAGLVSFEGRSTRGESSWTGDDGAAPGPVVSDSTFAPPPSTLVSVTDRESLDFERLLARSLEIARPRLAPFAGRIGRDEALRAIDAAVDEVIRGERQAGPSPELRERVVLVALSEISGLGLIDRLWADRSVRGVFVNGPKSVFVEREDGLSAANEQFRDQAHLAELVGRLVERPSSGIAEFQLRDGSSGTVVFPPAAPDGPVLTIHRAEPGSATLARLLASDMLDQRTVSLLRIAMRARLNVLVLGSAGSGKTALLVALARDLDSASRIVTVARDRSFRWSASAKVELVASRATPYRALLGTAERLRPDVLVFDSLQQAEAETLGPLIARRGQGVLAACESAVASAAPMRWADIVIRLARGRDGLFRAVSLEDEAGTAVFVHDGGRWQRRLDEPAFAEKLHAAGYGQALSALLR